MFSRWAISGILLHKYADDVNRRHSLSRTLPSKPRFRMSRSTRYMKIWNFQPVGARWQSVDLLHINVTKLMMRQFLEDLHLLE